MTFTDAAAEVLRLVGRPLHYKEITDIAIEKNLLSHVGKSPEVTMGARLAAMLKKDSPDNPLVRVKPGVFALREWDEKTIKAGIEPKKGGKKGSKSEAPPRGRQRVEEALPEEAAPEGDEDELVEAQEKAPAEVEEAAPPIGKSAGDNGVDADSGAVAAEASDADDDAEEAESGTVARVSVPQATLSRPSSLTFEEDEEEDAEPPGPDDAMRAEAVAGAAEMFDEEDDDDQPILGGTEDARAATGTQEGEGRRRRRRRRRGRGNGPESVEAPRADRSGLPSYVATPAFEPRRENGRDVGRDSREPRDNREPRDSRESRDSREPRDSREMRDSREPRENRDVRDAGATEATYRGPQVIELTGGDTHALDDLAGRDLGDAVAAVLSTFDRNAGAVSLRQIAETAQRRGRLAGDVQLVQSQVAAAVRADNARRLAAGQRPRFRFAGGRVALTDWLLSGDLARLEQEALAAVERYREAARRAFARKLGELPGHAFVEVCVLAMERIGVGQLRAVRRAGASGGETHFSGVLKTPVDEMRLGVVIRRDGREIGRERVTELRGSLHHYNLATAGWILTAGQMLSGAREEAAIAGTAPIALHDGLAVARLCEENDVAVFRAKLPIAIPDLDLLEALRAS